MIYHHHAKAKGRLQRLLQWIKPTPEADSSDDEYCTVMAFVTSEILELLTGEMRIRHVRITDPGLKKAPHWTRWRHDRDFPAVTE